LKKFYFIFLLFTTFYVSNIYCQAGFRFINSSQAKERIRFKLINNLIVIPININGNELSFILDTGVNKTILFNLPQNDTLGLKNVEKVQLQGLGSGEPVDALLSKNNRFQIKNIVSNNENFYVVLKDFFNLSSKMGMTIRGIIGFNLLKNLVLKINYKTQTIDFFNSKTFRYKTCRKCEVFPLQFYRRKPYVNAQVQLDTIGSKLLDIKVLLDSGGSDAIWLFENDEEIRTPKRFFNDLLGEGLSGPIYGNRSRIPKLKLGKFVIQKPTVSFLDSSSTIHARKFKQRNGSIGGDVLKRFKVWIDYPNRRITLKKNASLTKGFNYNMSGLDVIYSGKQLVKEKVVESADDSYGREMDKNTSISFITRYFFKFKPSFKINKVLKNSPSDKAGVLEGDILLKINGKNTYELTMNDIIYKFQERDKKKISLVVDRNGKKMKFQFRLEKKI
jgi:hypothetical protein